MTFKENLSDQIRDSFERNAGFLGRAMQYRREKQEHEKAVQRELKTINKGTIRLASTRDILANIETSFISISRNMQLIAKAYEAEVTLQEETNKAMGVEQQQSAQRTKKQAELIPKQDQSEDAKGAEPSFFEKIFDLLDDLGRKGGRGGGRGGKGPKPTKRVETARKRAEEAARKKGASKEGIKKAGERAAEKATKREATAKASKAAVKASARKAFAKAFAKMAAKSIPIVGAGIGVAFAVERLIRGDVVGAGIEAVGGLGSAATAIPATIANTARDVYFESYGVYPENDPLVKERYDEIYAWCKEAAEEELGTKLKKEPTSEQKPQPAATPEQKPQPAATQLPPTGAGGGRGAVNPQQVTPEALPTNAILSGSGEAVRSGSGEVVTSSPVEKPQPSGTGKFSNVKDFIAALQPYAEKVSQMIGGKVPSVAILGQWAGESGAGSSMPAPFNYAGIKAGSQFEKGDFVLTEERYTDAQLEKAKKSGEELAAVLGPDDKITKKGRQVTVDEWYGKGAWQAAKNEGKNWVQVKSYFAKFKNFDDFATSFAKFISAPRYAKAREQTTPAGFGFEIAKAGYATASAEKYSAKIANFAASQSGSDLGNMSTAVASAKTGQQAGSTTIIVAAASDTKKAPATQGPRKEIHSPIAA